MSRSQLTVLFSTVVCQISCIFISSSSHRCETTSVKREPTNLHCTLLPVQNNLRQMTDHVRVIRTEEAGSWISSNIQSMLILTRWPDRGPLSVTEGLQTFLNQWVCAQVLDDGSWESTRRPITVSESDRHQWVLGRMIQDFTRIQMVVLQQTLFDLLRPAISGLLPDYSDTHGPRDSNEETYSPTNGQAQQPSESDYEPPEPAEPSDSDYEPPEPADEPHSPVDNQTQPQGVRIADGRTVFQDPIAIRDATHHQTNGLENHLDDSAHVVTDLEVLDFPDCAARRFLENLHMLFVEELQQDERNCPICQEPYISQDGTQNEEAVMLPKCTHIFGHKCIIRWIDPRNDSPRNSCPLCRDELFELDDARSETIEAEEWDAPEFLSAIAQSAILAWTSDILDARTQADYRIPTRDGHFDLNLLFTARVLHHFRLFTNGHGTERRNIAFALRGQMGMLYQRLDAQLERIGVPFLWGSSGPRVDLILDRSSAGLIELALMRMVEVEWLENYGQNEMGRELFGRRVWGLWE